MPTSVRNVKVYTSPASQRGRPERKPDSLPTPVPIKLAKKGQLQAVLVRSAYPSFKEAAACFGAHTELFYSEDAGDIREAKSYCTACPVVKQCADWALKHEDFGTFGGLTEKERFMLRGGKPALNPQDIDAFRAEMKFILQSPAREVAKRYQVDTRTVVRWRKSLKSSKAVA